MSDHSCVCAHCSSLLRSRLYRNQVYCQAKGTKVTSCTTKYGMHCPRLVVCIGCACVCVHAPPSRQSCLNETHVHLFVVCRISTRFAMRQAFDIGCAAESFVTFCSVGFLVVFFVYLLRRREKYVHRARREPKNSNAKIKLANFNRMNDFKMSFSVSIYSRFLGQKAL